MSASMLFGWMLIICPKCGAKDFLPSMSGETELEVDCEDCQMEQLKEQHEQTVA